MRAPLFPTLLHRLPRVSGVVPLLAAALAAGCPPEEPEPVEIPPSIKLDVPRSRVTLGSTIVATFDSKAKGGGPAAGDVVITVGPVEGDTAPGEAFVGPDEANANVASFSVTPAAGEGGFVLRCGNTAGKVQVLVEATDTGETDSSEVTCIAFSNFSYSVTPRKDVGCARLQADGVSSCEVTLEVTKQAIGSQTAPEPAADEAIDVVVTEVTNVVILDGVRGVSLDGIPEVLAASPELDPSTRLAGILTGSDGKVKFFVRSPEFGVSQSVGVSVSVRGIEKSLAFDFAPFENQSQLSVTASKSELESGRSSTVSVAVKRTDGAPAAGARVTMTSGTPAASFTESQTVSVAAGVATVQLDEAGEGSVVVTAPEVAGRSVPVLIATTYDPGVNAEAAPPLVSTLTLSVSERGSVIGNAGFTENSLRSDVADGPTVSLFITAESGDEPFADVAVEASIASDSQALIAFSGTLGGTDRAFRELPSLSAAAAGTIGRVEFPLQAVSSIARGTATVNVRMTQGGSTIFQDSRTLIVDRDPILQSIVFLAADPPVIGVRGGTRPSTSSVTFQLIDDTGNPLGGVPVTFTTNATADRGVTVEQADISGADGVVRTALSAGSIAGPVTVVVVATPSRGESLTVESASIAIVGGLPTFLNSDFRCEQRSGRVFDTTCTAQLVDRFTNRVGPATQVQFRAEGGNVTPSNDTDENGVAESVFRSGNPGRPDADVLAWSYGRSVPEAGLPNFAGAAACLDATTATACDLIQLCNDSDTADRCPLPGRQSQPDLLPVTKSGVGAAATFEVESSRRCDADLARDPRACGFPVGCLNGTGTDCEMNMGCFDFSPETLCPQSGLLTIIATARGEESFLDGNGNGILDFVDLNGNGRHEVGEPIGVPCRRGTGINSIDPNCIANPLVAQVFCLPGADTCFDGVRQVDDFIDTPEPFLDKNGSCSRDNYLYATANDMTQVERQVATDLFSDIDGSLTYGFRTATDNVLSLTNGNWDRDTEIVLETHVLQVGEPRLVVGEACDPSLGRHTCTESASLGFSTGTLDSACTELADGIGIAEDCNPFRLQIGSCRCSDGRACTPELTCPVGLPRLPTSGNYLFTWIDANGNCPATDFEVTTVTFEAFGAVFSNRLSSVLDERACGFSSDSDADRPWCRVAPVLGAPVFPVNVAYVCGTSDNLLETGLEFELQDPEESVKLTFSSPVACAAPRP